jgi:hypothetical protein
MLKAKFSALSRLLHELGFTARTKEGRYTRFDHAETGAWFLYPDYADDEDLAASDLVGTRYQLDFRGMLPRDKFDERIKAGSVAG